MKKIIALLLILCTVCSLAVACVQKPEEQPSEEKKPTDYYADTSYEYKELDSGIQISNAEGLTEYIILVPTTPSEPTVELEVATTLRDLFWDLYGVRIRIAGATQRPTKMPEILIGETVREKMGLEVDRSGLGDDGYFVRNYGEHIVFAANSDEALWNSMYDFVRSYLGYDAARDTTVQKRDTKQFFLPDEVFIRRNGKTNDKIDITLNGKDLSKYTVVSGRDCGTSYSMLTEAFHSMTGKNYDVILSDKNGSIAELEIVVGHSQRNGKEFTVDEAAIADNECAVHFIGGRLIFTAKSQLAYVSGLRQFLTEYFGYAKGETSPSADITLSFAEGLVKKYSVDTAISEFYAGTADYVGIFSNNMMKMAGEDDFCFSDAKLLKKVTSRVRTQAKYGDVNMAYVPSVLCDCDTCKALAEQYNSPYGAYYDMIVKVAKTLQDEGATNFINIIAFNDTFCAPNAVFTPNVRVTVGDRCLCSAHCVGDTACETNRAFAVELDRWFATGATVSVMDFTSDFAYFPATFPNFYTAYQNIQYYAEKGVHTVYMHYNTAQASLEFGDLRAELFTGAALNTTMSKEEFRAAMVKAATKIYGEGDGALIVDYIDLMTEAAAGSCFSANDDITSILPIPYTVDETTGRKQYDLTTAIRAHKIWDQIHPYYEALGQSKVLLNMYLYNMYQGTPEAHAYAQYSAWLLANIDMQDYATVVNQIFEATNAQ